MSTLESLALGYLLNSLWQVPLLFAAAWLAARALRSAGPALEHRIWVGALLLQGLLPACSLASFDWLRNLSLWTRHPAAPGDPQVSVVTGPGTGSGVLHLPSALLAAITLTFAIILAYFVARLLWRCHALTSIRRTATPLHLAGDAARCWTLCCQRFAIHNACLAASPRIFGPVTLGLRRRLVLLPTGMVENLSAQDLQTVIAHEFAHMRRQDFLKNLLYEALSLPVCYHPVLWLTRERVIETREMICDGLAAEVAGRNEYARSLLRLASLLLNRRSFRTPHAIGIFDANEFQRRLMKLTEKPIEIRGARRAAVVAACLAFGIGICGSALAMRIHVDPGAAKGDSKPAASSKAVRVSAGVMAGSLLTHVNPVYPTAAREAKVQGSVILHATIGKSGAIENLTVISGPEDLQASALDAVRQWTYKPFLLNGNPVEVETTITVNYSIFP